MLPGNNKWELEGFMFIGLENCYVVCVLSSERVKEAFPMGVYASSCSSSPYPFFSALALSVF